MATQCLRVAQPFRLLRLYHKCSLEALHIWRPAVGFARMTMHKCWTCEMRQAAKMGGQQILLAWCDIQSPRQACSEWGLCQCRFYAAECCGPVQPTVGDMSLIMQQVPSDTVANAWFHALGSTSLLGSQSSFDLARCLAQNQQVVSLNVS